MNVSQRAFPRLSINTQRRDCQQRNLLRVATPSMKLPTALNLFDGISHPALIRFVQAVLKEPECKRVMEMPLTSSGSSSSAPVERFHAAGWRARRYSAPSRIQAEVIYAGTVILGLQNLMRATVRSEFVGDTTARDVDLLANCAQDDVFRAIARSALYKLETEAPIHAGLLRIVLNWGNQDEMLDEETQRMQSIARQSSRLCAGGLELMKRPLANLSGEFLHG